MVERSFVADELGNGQSTASAARGPRVLTVDLFLRELDNLLDHLGIRDRYALLGQSWGGMLGSEHAVRKPAGLKALVIANSPADIRTWVAKAQTAFAGIYRLIFRARWTGMRRRGPSLIPNISPRRGLSMTATCAGSPLGQPKWREHSPRWMRTTPSTST